MAQQFNFKKAERARSKLRLAITGPSGSGKTYTALIAATVMAEGGKIAVIDTERGSASLYADKFEFDVLELDTYHPQVYIDAIKAAEQAGYNAIVIDSLSHAWEGESGALELVDKAAARNRGNSYVAWRDVTPLQRSMVDAMLKSSAHIIATMRSKMDYVQEQDERGKTVIRKIGMAPVQRQGMEYEFTFVGDMDVDHKLIVSKSRCDLVADAVVTKPGPDFFNPILTWLNSGSEQKPAAAPKPATKDAPKPTRQVQTPAAPKQNANGSNNARPMQPEALKVQLDAWTFDYNGTNCTDKHRQLLASILDNTVGGEVNRHAVMRYLTGNASVKDVPGAYILAMLKSWLAVTGWDDAPQPEAITEARAVLQVATVSEDQPTLI